MCTQCRELSGDKSLLLWMESETEFSAVHVNKNRPVCHKNPHNGRSKSDCIGKWFFIKEKKQKENAIQTWPSKKYNTDHYKCVDKQVGINRHV